MAKPINRKAILKALLKNYVAHQVADKKAWTRLDKIEDKIYSLRRKIIKELDRVEYGLRYKQASMKFVLFVKFERLCVEQRELAKKDDKARMATLRAEKAYKKELDRGNKRGGRKMVGGR